VGYPQDQKEREKMVLEDYLVGEQARLSFVGGEKNNTPFQDT